ncbi:hypothetical protein T03_7503 [Trichinella britovi]|uniref:Uncharacterized protein n=1 Tax=Trichinella britovi TaxID=45882 RepID=A0A0V1CXG1_TRIBR|nr:hypothetical protein T03_7503 [Trichinella britovi]
MRQIDDDACSWLAASFTLSTLMGSRENIFILIYPEYFLQLGCCFLIFVRLKKQQVSNTTNSSSSRSSSGGSGGG